LAFGSDPPRAWPKPHHVVLGGGGAVVILLVGLWIWWVLPSFGHPQSYCDLHPQDTSCLAPPCPRPTPAPAPPGFGGQEYEIRDLRRRAFAGDFFAQVDLAHRYTSTRSIDANLKDPVESAVWYATALANQDGWSGVDRPLATQPQQNCVLFFCGAGPGGQSAYAPTQISTCRDLARQEAYQNLEALASNFTGFERQEVRDRVIYLLATQGSKGYLTLSRMYDRNYATFGEPWSDPVAAQANVTNTSAIFVRSDADAWLYDYLAAGTGDVAAYMALKNFETNFPDKAEALVPAANRWTPPFEFYPPEPPENKTGAEQYSDESRITDAADEYALRAFEAVPFVHVSRALCFLQVAHCECNSLHELDPHAAGAFHAMIGEPIQDPFTLVDGVRAIQLAAVRGSADAQLLLAVMYSEGIGVRADYARSLKWFEAAAHQGSPAAQFAVSNYFALGVEGVSDQDKAAAVAQRLASAVDGFHPSAQRLRDLMAHIHRNLHSEKPPQ
jgi:TPR repeat protein